ncbi:MAG: DNA adenine methylase [Planctomycetales bacterium]
MCQDLPSRPTPLRHEITSVDYRDRLAALEPCTVYADPPYQFVHYSRFYHALETIQLYDYPEIQKKAGRMDKGRYRENRHQSPFCQKTQVRAAFESLFRGVGESESNLVLSYSDAGMIQLCELENLARETMRGYEISVTKFNHRHMTMGRKGDRDRDVQEALMTAQRGNCGR